MGQRSYHWVDLLGTHFPFTNGTYDGGILKFWFTYVVIIWLSAWGIKEAVIFGEFNLKSESKTHRPHTIFIISDYDIQVLNVWCCIPTCLMVMGYGGSLPLLHELHLSLKQEKKSI